MVILETKNRPFDLEFENIREYKREELKMKLPSFCFIK